MELAALHGISGGTRSLRAFTIPAKDTK